jgi:hypothetical protein
MRKKYFHLIAIILTISLLACNKPNEGFQNAEVVDSGDITSDGCGFILRFDDGREEKPYQLLSAYQHNGMLVKVKYHVSEVLDTCGSSKPYSYYQLIIIDEIKRRLN